MSDNIHVAVRMRPLIARERESKASIHWKAEGCCILHKNQPSTKFQFDRVFREIDTNEIVYTEFCSPLVKSVIDGFNGTIFAYGQTSTGKSFTMMGKDDGKELGIIHHTISDIFSHIQEMSEREFLLRVSYMEIYNEAIIDLLSEKSENLKLKEDRDGIIRVSGLSEHIVQKPDQVLEFMRKGEKKRKTGDTNMNERSSRSHSIFQVIIESGIRGDDNSAVNVSQFNLVDLAGSERASQTGAKGTRFKESININKSLLTLSQVISQLSERPDQFINYRDSKLTRILQNSLGGNARTAIICTITPATVEETLSTLKFATRAKCIRNKPQVNEIVTEQALLKRYANEIKKLTQELEATKEEKALQNKSLQEQIMSLRNKFVSQMALKNERRTARRETWGGCLDAAKFKVPFPPPRSILRSAASVSEDLNCAEDLIVSTNSSLQPEKDLQRMTSTGRSKCLDLSTVEEECEFDTFDGTFMSRQSKYLSSRFSNVPSYSETAVQTDMSPEKKLLSDPELILVLQTTVKKLKEELAELKEFTSLEKQVMRACNRTSSNFEDQIKEYGNESLLTEIKTPQRVSSRFSLGGECNELLSTLNKISSTPLKHSSLKNNESSIDKFGYEKDELFEFLNDTVNLLGKQMQNSSISKTGELSDLYKVILNMFGLMLQYQCSKVNDNEYLSTKKVDTLESLSKILGHFSNKSKPNEGLIEEFMNKTNDLLKEIEMLSLDCDNQKATENILSLDVTNMNHCFDVSLIKTRPSTNFLQNSISESTLLKTDVAVQSVELLKNDAEINTCMEYPPLNSEMTNLKSQIAELEKDVATHLKTISELQEDIDLKNDQVASFEVEMQLQNEIVECLKEELAAKDKEITSSKMVQDTNPLSLEDKLDCSSQTSYLEEKETDAGKISQLDSGLVTSVNKSDIDTEIQKISTLEKEVSMNKKLISDLKYEKDSKEKQIALCNDKIKIQEQIILSLQNEVSLKTEENISSGKTVFYSESSTQTFYLEDVTSHNVWLSRDGSEDEISVFDEPETTASKNKQITEISPKETTIQILEGVDEKDNCLGLSNGEPGTDDTSLKLALNMFKEIKQFTVEFMEKNIDEVYFREVSRPDSSNKHATVQQCIQEESNTIKELLRRIEFYLKDKCESYEYFQNVLKDTSNEVFDLKSKLEDTESKLNRNEVKMKELIEVFKELENNALVFMEKFEAPKSLKWKDSISSTVLSTVLKYIPMLKIVNKMLRYFVEERESLMSKENCSSDKKENACHKLSKSVQTVEDERAIQISKEMDELKIEKGELLVKITDLNSRIEKIKKFREEAECSFKEKETMYKTEIQNLKLLFDTEKNTWTENAKKCVQSVEEKYDQMMNEQEVRFGEELDRVTERLKGHVQEKELYKELVAKHEQEITQLNKKQMNLQDQLSKALTAHCNERRELENTISTLKKDISSRTEVITKLKYKYNSHALELQKLKARAAKSTREWGIQTDPSPKTDEKSDKEQTSSSNAGLSSPTTCTESNVNINEEAAKILSIKNEALIREVADLKKELSSKTLLLRTCRCRLAPYPQVKSQQVCEKCSEPNGNMAQKKDAKSSGNRGGEITFSSTADILQSDIVKNAIELEVEKERYKLSDSGTASTLVNCALKKDLHSKEKALAAAKKEIAELKAYARKRNAFPVKENHPFLLPSLEEKDVTLLQKANHPFPHGEVPKLPTKNMLKERNKGPHLTNHPDVFSEKPVFSYPGCISKDPSVKENSNEKEGRKKDLVLETKRQLECFESSEPECKHQ